MPPRGSSPPRARRPARCSYSEQGRRCVRNGVEDTDPPLCNVHRVVFSDLGRPPPKRSAAVDVFNDLLSGNRVSRDRIEDALGEVFGNWSMGGGMASGYYPDIAEDGSTDHHGDGRFRPPPDFRPPPGWNPGSGRTREREQDPYEAVQNEEVEARLRARQVLGFAATEPIDKDKLRTRHRELVKKWHPDRAGGNLEKMTLINAAVDVLEAAL